MWICDSLSQIIGGLETSAKNIIFLFTSIGLKCSDSTLYKKITPIKPAAEFELVLP